MDAGQIDIDLLQERGLLNSAEMVALIRASQADPSPALTAALESVLQQMTQRKMSEAAPLEHFLRRTTHPDLPETFPEPIRRWSDEAEGNSVEPVDPSYIPPVYWYFFTEKGAIDLSFCVIKQGLIIGMIKCELKKSALTRYFFPINIYLTHPHHERSAMITIARYMNYLASKYTILTVKIANRDDFGEIVEANSNFRIKNATDSLTCYVDLQKDEAAIRSCIRKSYRNLINVGRRVIEKREIQSLADLTEDELDFIRGADGYSLKSFQILMNMTQERQAFAFLYSVQGVPIGFVGAAQQVRGLNSRLPKTEYAYWMGAYNKEQGTPTHYCLYDTMMHCKNEAGGTYFHLCQQEEAQQPPNKVANIQFFKMGMSTAVSHGKILELQYAPS